MDWRPAHDGRAALGSGRAWVYLVSGDVSADGEEVTAVRLTRWLRPNQTAKMFPTAVTLAAEAAARNVIVFPIGRGPGRPAGEPELAALMAMAKDYAERFEAGGDLEAYPHWRQPLPVLDLADNIEILMAEVGLALDPPAQRPAAEDGQ
jgi:sugar phosphate isomerase/epimerase